MTYIVRRASKGWSVFAESNRFIGNWPTRRAAILTARLLAGWRGSVQIEVR